MEAYNQQESLTWGDIMDSESPINDFEPGESSNSWQEASGCLQHQRSQPPTQPAAQTPDQRGARGHQGYQQHQQHHQAPGRRQEGGQRENHHQAHRQRGGRGRRGNNHHVPYNPGHQSRPPPWVMENTLRNRIEELNTLLQQEREMRSTMRHQLDLSKTKITELQERVNTETAAKQHLEGVVAGQNIRLLLATSNGPRTNNTPSPEEQIELQQHVTSLQNQLQEEKLRAEELGQENQALKQDLEEAKREAQRIEILHGEQLEQQTTQLQEEKLRAEELGQENQALKQELEEAKREAQRIEILHGEQLELQTTQLQEEKLLAEELGQENQALKQELEETKRKAQRIEILHGEQLELQTTQLQEKTRSCLELASKLKEQEEVSQALREEVETLRQQRHQETVTTEEPSLQEDIEEEPPIPDQETSDNTQMAPETVEEPSKMAEISLWRRFKKAVTPRSCRQYKQQRQHQE